MATTPRFTGAKNQDNTGRVYLIDYQNPAYAATLNIAIKASAADTLFVVSPITGPMTINIGVGGAGVAPFVGDVISLQMASDGTTRTVTFGTGFAVTAATIVVTTAKFALMTFQFNGTAWVEQSRAVTV